MCERERGREIEERESTCVCVSAIFLFCDFNLSIVGHGQQTNDSRLATLEPSQTKQKNKKGQKGGAGVAWNAQGCPLRSWLLFLINLL